MNFDFKEQEFDYYNETDALADSFYEWQLNKNMNRTLKLKSSSVQSNVMYYFIPS
jgi:hypothetical protein